MFYYTIKQVGYIYQAQFAQFIIQPLCTKSQVKNKVTPVTSL